MSLAVDQNSLTLKGNSDMNLRLARNQFVLLELGVIAKDLSAGLMGNKNFCFLSTLMFLEAKHYGSFGKMSLFPMVPVIKCL